MEHKRGGGCEGGMWIAGDKWTEAQAEGSLRCIAAVYRAMGLCVCTAEAGGR